MLEAINEIKADLLSHSRWIGETEERVSQAEEDITTLQQTAEQLEGTVGILSNKIQNQEDQGRRSDLRFIGLPEKKKRGPRHVQLSGKKLASQSFGWWSHPRPSRIEVILSRKVWHYGIIWLFESKKQIFAPRLAWTKSILIKYFDTVHLKVKRVSLLKDYSRYLNLSAGIC